MVTFAYFTGFTPLTIVNYNTTCYGVFQPFFIGSEVGFV